MKRLYLLLLLSVIGYGQSFTLSGPTVARIGGTVNITLSMSVPTPSPVVAEQFVLGLPSGWMVTGVTLGAVVTGGAKTGSCTTDNLFCLLYGFNTNVIGSGGLITWTVKVPSGTPLGNVNIPVSGVVMADVNANVVSVVGTLPTYSVVVKKKLGDVNGDGVVDDSDATAMAQEILAARGNPGACVDDWNSDGVCDVRDLVIVVNNKGM